jgi:hypothetical protein
MPFSVPLRPVAVRVLFVGLLIAGYVTAWRPARDWLSGHVAAPLLRQVDTPRAQQYTIHGAPDRIVEIRTANRSAPVATFMTPAGALFVVGGVLLLLLAPWRPYWLYLGLYQLLLGAGMLATLAVGLGWTDAGFVVYDFLRGTVYPGTSLAAPLLVYGLQVWADDGLPAEPDPAST